MRQHIREITIGIGLVIGALLAGGLWGQVSPPPSIIFRAAAPTGACAVGAFNWQNTTSGVLYTCAGGTWTAISGGSFGYTVSGTGTVLPTTQGATVTDMTLLGTTTFGNGTASGEIQLSELLTNGTDYLSWLAPNSITTTTRFRLPATAPSAGQVMAWGVPSSLISDATWTTLAASATTDTTNASNINSGTLDSARLPGPGASAKGGVLTTQCSSGHAIGYDSSGAPVCTADSGGGGGTIFSTNLAATAAGALSTSYAYPQATGLNGSSSARRTVLPVSGTMSKLYIVTSSAQPALCDLTVLVQKNDGSTDTDTAVTLTIPAGSAAGVYTSGSTTASFSAGDRWVWKLVSTSNGGTCASSSAALLSISMVYTW